MVCRTIVIPLVTIVITVGSSIGFDTGPGGCGFIDRALM